MKKEWEREVIERCSEWNVGKGEENWSKWEELMYKDEEVVKKVVKPRKTKKGVDSVINVSLDEEMQKKEMIMNETREDKTEANMEDMTEANMEDKTEDKTEYEKDSKKKRPKKEKVEKVEKENNKDTDKKKSGRPKKTKEVLEKTETNDLFASLVEKAEKMEKKATKNTDKKEKNSEEDNEEAVKVRVKEIKGEKYLVSDKKVVYDKETNEELGVWVEETDSIELVEEEIEE
jgi:phage-related minor tail protein